MFTKRPSALENVYVQICVRTKITTEMGEGLLKYKRRKFRVLPIDADFDAHNQGSLARIDETISLPQAAKKLPATSLSQMIEQRTWENEQLRKELIYQPKKHGVSMYLLDEVRLVVESLQKALRIDFIDFQYFLEIHGICLERWTRHLLESDKRRKNDLGFSKLMKSNVLQPQAPK
jgi:hypothetical protein